MDNKFLAVLVAIAVLTGVVALKGNEVNVNVPEFQAGASSGPDSYFPCETHNGVLSCFNRVSFTSASSTLCAIKSPAVDSRLEHLSAFFTTLPNFATKYMVGSGTMNATTTSLIALTQLDFAAGTTLNASSSVASSTTSILIPANTWVNLNYSTSTSAVMVASLSPTGRCEAVFVGV